MLSIHVLISGLVFWNKAQWSIVFKLRNFLFLNLAALVSAQRSQLNWISSWSDYWVMQFTVSMMLFKDCWLWIHMFILFPKFCILCYMHNCQRYFAKKYNVFQVLWKSTLRISEIMWGRILGNRGWLLPLTVFNLMFLLCRIFQRGYLSSIISCSCRSFSLFRAWWRNCTTKPQA